MTNHQMMLRATLISLVGNILLFALKGTALIKVNSLAIMTDLGITLVGLVVSGILYYSVTISNRPADLLHNYGYGKIEHVCEALEGVILIGIALAMSFQAIMHLLHPSEITVPLLGFGFSAVAATINFIGAKWIINLGNQCNSPAVRAEGTHYKLEGYISSTVAVAFLLTVLILKTPLKAWAVYLDPAATLAVSLLIAFPSVHLAKTAFIKLLDSSIEEHGKMEILKQLGKYINSCCEFRGIRSRSSGRTKYVELELMMPPQMSIVEAHKIAESIEQDLQKNISDCHPTVILRPCQENCSSHNK